MVYIKIGTGVLFPHEGVLAGLMPDSWDVSRGAGGKDNRLQCFDVKLTIYEKQEETGGESNRCGFRGRVKRRVPGERREGSSNSENNERMENIKSKGEKTRLYSRGKHSHGFLRRDQSLKGFI